jgi:hypothetical protein
MLPDRATGAAGGGRAAPTAPLQDAAEAFRRAAGPLVDLAPAKADRLPAVGQVVEVAVGVPLTGAPRLVVEAAVELDDERELDVFDIPELQPISDSAW